MVACPLQRRHVHEDAGHKQRHRPPRRSGQRCFAAFDCHALERRLDDAGVVPETGFERGIDWRGLATARALNGAPA